jgi:alanine racemase
MKRPTWAEVNLDHLAFNFQSVKSFIGKDISYMAVVKANGYGHGAVNCSKRLENEGVDWFGVALPEEGLELRKAGITKPILCLGSFWAGQEKLLLDNDLTPVIFRLEIAEVLNQAAKKRGIITDIHVKIDTGMNRVGVRFDELIYFVQGLKKCSNLRVDGLMTHFAAADNLNQNEFTNLQIKRFNESVALFEAHDFYPTLRDLSNSPGAIGHSNGRGNMVRLGGVIYGLSEDVLPKNIEKPELKPVMSLQTEIAYIKLVPKGETLGYSRTFTVERDSLIATIPIGYHDGYVRGLSNCGKVIVNGVYANVVGRVSMDWTLIDVTNVPNIKIKDKVILIGEQNELKITAEELAKLANTISYELTCGINSRVRKVYKD